MHSVLRSAKATAARALLCGAALGCGNGPAPAVSSNVERPAAPPASSSGKSDGDGETAGATPPAPGGSTSEGLPDVSGIAPVVGEGGGAGPARDAGAGATDASVVAPTPSAGADRCDEAVLDPGVPLAALPLSGNLGAHDPALVEADGVFYMFLTGDDLGAKTSTDLISWERQPDVFQTQPRPAWIAQQIPAATNLWAPDIAYFGGEYHLYFSASTFGENTSCIGHMARPRLDAGTWEDRGPVICSSVANDYNAIDPNVVVDVQGTPWLSFGSFWDGIRAIELDASGARANQELHALASRGGGAIEAPFIVRRCGYYYLFVSFDACCRGADSTYNTRVGRSESVLGPYLDREGRALLDGGGTQLVRGDDTWRGPGHNAVIFTGGKAYNVYHAYAAADGAPLLRIAELGWDEEGWPVAGGP